MTDQDTPATSDALAKAMSTNPVVVRRVMAGLRDQGLVRSDKGHGGGWTLTCDPSKVTLRDIYTALGAPTLFAIGNRSGAPDCLVEQSVNSTLDQTFRNAENLLLSRMEGMTLEMLNIDVQRRLATRTRSKANPKGAPP